RPGLSLVHRDLAELADLGGSLVVEGEAPHPLALGDLLRPGDELERAVLEDAVDELDDAALVVDPSLLPAALVLVVDVEALPVPALQARPVLEDHAIAEDQLDAALPGGSLRRRVADVPLADPEIELPRLRVDGARTRVRLDLDLRRGVARIRAHAREVLVGNEGRLV